MGVQKFVIACFDDEKTLFPAVKQVRKTGYKIQHELHWQRRFGAANHSLAVNRIPL